MSNYEENWKNVLLFFSTLGVLCSGIIFDKSLLVGFLIGLGLGLWGERK